MLLCPCRSTITVKELDALIAELAKKYKDDKKCDEAEAVTKIKEKMSNAQPKGHGTTVSGRRLRARLFGGKQGGFRVRL